MIYSNTNITAEEREFSFGKLNVIALGEKGRGRQEIVLPCPPNTTVRKGENPDLTIGFSKAGKPKIISCYEKEDSNYFLLSSSGGYTRRGNGDFRILEGFQKEYLRINEESFENPNFKKFLQENKYYFESLFYLVSKYQLIHKYELASGNGADGDAGRIGTWDVTLLQFPSAQDITIKIYYSGGGNRVEYIQQKNGVIQSFTPEDLEVYDGELNFIAKEKEERIIKKIADKFMTLDAWGKQEYSLDDFSKVLEILDNHNKDK